MTYIWHLFHNGILHVRTKRHGADKDDGWLFFTQLTSRDWPFGNQSWLQPQTAELCRNYIAKLDCRRKNAIAHQVCQSIKYKEVWGIHGRFKLCEDMQDCSLWELFFVPVFQPLGIIGPYHHYLSATIWIKRLKERKLWVQLLGSRWATSLGSGQLIVFLPQGQASPSLTHCRVMKLVSFPSLS